jgi:hypothetical protein
MATFHLEGEAQMWYQLIRESDEVLTWDSLKIELHIFYGPIVFEDHFGDLTKLQQTESIREYSLNNSLAVLEGCLTHINWDASSAGLRDL